MSERIVSAVAVAPKTTELQEFNIPEIPPDAGLLKVEAAGVCGADWPAYLNEIKRRRSGRSRGVSSLRHL
jgi:D-arabinose 1-dehydrogenase-like Zn-dependent alcohol dehydrogenase